MPANAGFYFSCNLTSIMLPLFHYYSSIELPQMWAIAHALLGGMLVRYGYELYVLADQMEDN